MSNKPFNRYQKPVKQNLFFMPFLWLYCYFTTKKANLKIKKKNMVGLKPPYLLLSTHHSFTDFLVAPLAIFPHRANYISELEGFEYYGEWLYRQIGCMGTRKFINDVALVKNIKYAIKDKRIVVIYPEARYCNVGTNSKLPQSIGKLAKMLQVPVVVLNMNGNYLQSPIWNLKVRKEVSLEANISQILSISDLNKLSIDKINHIIQSNMIYDDYKWQYEKKMTIATNNRAQNLHLPLYQCPSCKTEFKMDSNNFEIFCLECNSRWQMNEYGRLESLENDTEYPHIPDWYEFQRECVKKEIDSNKYYLDIKVNIEALPNAKKFIPLENGNLKHSNQGFILTFADEELSFHPRSMSSIHTEYNYRNKGVCIVLSTLDNSYFIYPLEKNFNPTKIQFAVEYLYDLYNKK